jgi:hypothetical protein
MKIICLQIKRKNLALLALAFVVLLVLTPQIVAAQQSSSLAQSFQTDTSKGSIVPGALVNLKPGTQRNVVLSTLSSADQLIGIVDQNPLVSISRQGEETQVVLSGTTTVLVSDINGAVKGGDKITVSPIAGVGMRATANSTVVGTAQSAFTSTNTKSIADKNGKNHTVRVGYVEIQVGVAYYQAPGSDFLPPFIQSIANSVAGRPVSLIRILVCSVLLLLGFTSVVILVYTSVRSAMTSIGRNPLAARAIRKGLYQIGAVAVVVIGSTLLASYLILSL